MAKVRIGAAATESPELSVAHGRTAYRAESSTLAERVPGELSEGICRMPGTGTHCGC